MNNVRNLSNYTTGNGVQTSYTYNSLNRLTNVGVSKTATTLASYAYTLGAAGNRTSVTEANGRTSNYTYDNLYRLTNETIANATGTNPNGSISYTYDAVGNRLSRTSTVAGVPTVASQSVDANDRLTTDGYDNNGNTTGSNGNGYVYDFENRLIKVNAGTANEISIVYDGDGNRVKKTVAGVATKFLVDTNNLTGYAQVVEEIQGGNVTRQYSYGHDLLSQRLFTSNQPPTTSFYQYDGHGSVRGLTDATGALTDTFTYDAFGVLINRTGTTPNLYLYAGEQYDPDLGLYYNRARYLNTNTGRFWSQDSYEGNSSDPTSLHKYLYANSNPVNGIDPSGNFTLAESLVVVGTVLTISAISYLGYQYYKWKNSTVFLGVEWRNLWTLGYDDKQASFNYLSDEEISIVKMSAYEELRKAVSGFKVVVTEGGGTNKIIVSPELGVCGSTPNFASTVSKVYYQKQDSNARSYSKERGITDKGQILIALGKGIGATAAHEFSHQMGFPSDPLTDRLSWDYGSCDRPEHYFEELHWSTPALENLRKAIPPR